MNKTNSENFECINCHKSVKIRELLGSSNLNHCPNCLYSKHVDLNISGDRKAKCQGVMKPIGLTFKHEGLDKYGKKKQGELMLIHECCCGKISINRIAGNDNPDVILKVLKTSESLSQEIKNELKRSGINLLTNADIDKIKTQLFGNDLV